MSEQDKPTRDEVRDLVNECGLDWHRGFAPLFDGDDTNRYEVLVRAAIATDRAARPVLTDGQIEALLAVWFTTETTDQEGYSLSLRERMRAVIAADRAARVPVLTDELRELEQAEAHYRLTFQIAPSADHLDVGRAWDRMKKAGDKARAVLAATQGSKP